MTVRFCKLLNQLETFLALPNNLHARPTSRTGLNINKATNRQTQMDITDADFTAPKQQKHETVLICNKIPGLSGPFEVPSLQKCETRDLSAAKFNNSSFSFRTMKREFKVSKAFWCGFIGDRKLLFAILNSPDPTRKLLEMNARNVTLCYSREETMQSSFRSETVLQEMQF